MDFLIGWMSDHRLVVAEDHHRFAVWRDVWEPIPEVVVRGLREVRSVRCHPPDLHDAGAIAVKVDVLSIRRVLRTIVESIAHGKPSFLATSSGNGEDSVAKGALSSVGKSFAIG